MSHENDLRLEWKPRGRAGHGVLVARINGHGALYTDGLDATSFEQRMIAIDRIHKKCPGVPRELIEQQMEEIAAEALLGDIGANEKDKVTIGQRVAKLAEGADLFHSGDVAFATVTITNKAGVTRKETFPVNSPEFKRWLSGMFHKAHKMPAPKAAIEDAVSAIEGNAIHDGPAQPIAVRVAGHQGAVYLDLCDDERRVVKITKQGWSLDTDSPVKFLRKKGLKALPVPVRGGTLDRLRPLLNAHREEDHNRWVMMVAWLVGALQPRGPYALLIVNGEHGSAKSCASTMLSNVIDKKGATLRGLPREERDLMIAASNGWVCAYDNLSGLSDWISDALCRLSTGGGFSTRKLHTDESEILFEAKRPIILNGIDEGVMEDLLDRACHARQPVIDKYRPESEVFAEFELAHPEVLGALLDAVACALKNVDSVVLSEAAQRMFRFADFTKWIVAAEPALGWKPGTFVNAYMANRMSAAAEALEQSPIGPAIVSLMEHCSEGEWSGSATELLMTLEERHADEHTKRDKSWPRSGNQISAKLHRLAPVLRKCGIDVRHREKRSNAMRKIVLTSLCKDPKTSSPSSPSSPDPIFERVMGI
jgi:hypothetical protein